MSLFSLLFHQQIKKTKNIPMREEEEKLLVSIYTYTLNINDDPCTIIANLKNKKWLPIFVVLHGYYLLLY